LEVRFLALAEERFSTPGWCRNLIEAGGVQPGERVLVVVDEPLAEEGSELAAAVRDAGGEPQLELWLGERPLAEPPRAVAEAAQQADIYFFLAQEPRPDEAGARIALSEIARRHGGRAIFLGFVDRELLTGELSNPPPDLGASARKLLDEVQGADTVRIRGRAGTDLTVSITGRTWLTDALSLDSGSFSNYPGGEIFVSPLEDSAEGVLVADLTVPYTVEGLVDEPVTLRFRGGSVESIEGGRAAELLQGLVDVAGPSGRVIAELGIGLNPTVVPRGHIMLDEKAARTAHVAIGSNVGSYGGVNESTIHVDCVFSEPELEVDGRPVAIPVP
jgi:2,5-dihydroxypyridine 5,6-dioxygenase